MINKLSSVLIAVALAMLVLACERDEEVIFLGPGPTNDSLGVGWTKIQMPDSINFVDVFFVNTQVGYLLGKNPTTLKYLAKSTDGGLTWKRFDLPDSLTKNMSFINLYFSDADHGFAIGMGGSFLRTENGGASWQRIQVPGPTRDIQMFNNAEGYLIGSNGLFQTSDGGKNWQLVSGTIKDGIGLSFINKSTGWIMTSSSVVKTTNGGASFGPPVMIGEVDGFIQFKDASNGYISHAYTGISKTMDGGATWKKIVATTAGDFHFFDVNTGYMIIESRMFKTNDAGKTFVNMGAFREHYISEIHFVDPDHGWAVGSQGGFYKYVK